MKIFFIILLVFVLLFILHSIFSRSSSKDIPAPSNPGEQILVDYFASSGITSNFTMVTTKVLTKKTKQFPQGLIHYYITVTWDNGFTHNYLVKSNGEVTFLN